MNFFALCLSNPTPVILFASKKHNLLDKIPFQYLVNYCKVSAPVDTVRIHMASALSTSVKYKFENQECCSFRSQEW
jgi:hypothetical protein